jgi:hypothetical protein
LQTICRSLKRTSRNIFSVLSCCLCPDRPPAERRGREVDPTFASPDLRPCPVDLQHSSTCGRAPRDAALATGICDRAGSHVMSRKNALAVAVRAGALVAAGRPGSGVRAGSLHPGIADGAEVRVVGVAEQEIAPALRAHGRHCRTVRQQVRGKAGAAASAASTRFFAR